MKDETNKLIIFDNFQILIRSFQRDKITQTRGERTKSLQSTTPQFL